MPALDSDNKCRGADFPLLLGWQLHVKPYQLTFQSELGRVL